MQQALSQAVGTFERHSFQALSCSLWDCFGVVKVLTATNATNETRQHGIAWNQTSLGLTNKHFQPKPDLSINKTPRWTSANQPQIFSPPAKRSRKKTLSLPHWKDSHMKPNGVNHYDLNFFGLTLPIQKFVFVPRFPSVICGAVIHLRCAGPQLV